MLNAFAPGIFGQRVGTSPPQVLALHGWGRTSSDFTEALEGLPSIALDLPGFGASPSPSTAMGAAGYADLVEPVVRGLDGPVILVGHSFGGRVAAVLGSRSISQVVGVVFTGAPLVRPVGFVARKPSLSFRIAKTANKFGLLGDEAMEKRRRQHGSLDYRNATGVMRDVLVRVVRETYEDELARLSVPAWFVWGENDTEAPFAVAQLAAELAPNSRPPVSLPGVGHLVPTVAPKLLRITVDQALAECVSRS